MKHSRFAVLLLALTGAAQSQTPAAPAPKIALVNFQQAMISTNDGKAAEKQLDTRFGPRKKDLDAKEHEIATLQDKLEQGQLSDADRKALGQQIDEKTAVFNAQTAQADADLQEAQKKVLEDLAPKMIVAIARYAKDQGYLMVFDISESEAAKMYSRNAVDITDQIIADYDRRK